MSETNELPEFSFVLAGRPPLPVRNSQQCINTCRSLLEQQIADEVGDFFPIPPNVQVKLDVTLKYPTNINFPNMMFAIHIAREICLGILYVDNVSIFNKSVQFGRPEQDHPEGSTTIKIRPIVDT